MDELVKGVLLQHAGEALERVETLGVQYQLIASWDGTEVIRQLFSAGRIFGLRPEEGWDLGKRPAQRHPGPGRQPLRAPGAGALHLDGSD